MITKKSLLSIIALAITLILMFTFMHLMSLFRVSKWVGVGVGFGVMAVMLILLIVFRDKKFKSKLNPVHVTAVFVNGAASGVALSSLFVYLGGFPYLWHSACAVAITVALIFIYCGAANARFVQRHYIISLIIYSVLLIAAVITAIVLTVEFSFVVVLILVAIALIPLIAFLISLPMDASDSKEHIKHIAYCSLAALALVVIVVFLIISQGDGLDLSGIDGGAGGSVSKTRHNPYDYLTYTDSDCIM